MKLLLISAASLLLATGGVAAAPSATTQLYIASVAAHADARLANAGVAIPGEAVRVRATVSGDRLNGVRVVETTGDVAADRAIEQALRKMKVSQAPAELAGRDLILVLGPSPIVQARAR